MERNFTWKRTRLAEEYRQHRIGLLIDVLTWVLATPIAVLIRFDGEWKPSGLGSILALTFLGIILNLLFSILLRINFRNKSLGTLDQLILMFVSTSSTAIFLLLIRVTLEYPNLPRSIPILASILSLLFQIGFRAIPSQTNKNNQFQNPNLQRVLIYGAGKIGHQIAEQLLEYREIYKVIGFIDDNPKKIGTKIFGDKVLGNLDELGKVTSFFKPNLLIVAISNISGAKLSILRAEAQKQKIEVRIIPNQDKIISGLVQLSEIEPLDNEDLLGRPQVVQENTKVAELLKSSTVLVTGAAGSIGSEIVKQLHQLGTKQVYLLDRDENGLLRVKLDLDSKSDLNEKDVILGDIRDVEHLNYVFQELKPDIVFHAAALKHVSTLERFPEESIKTNFQGTKNVWKSAMRYSVPYFVNISSDKAADPVTQLGKSKLLAERIIASTPNSPQVKKYLSVRFGNVIGSNGSFVEIFRRQIERGGPVTVRSPEVTRFFMTVKEAVHLVLEALDVGNHGETLILDMGKPVKILDVANQMIRASGQNIEIEFTGLRPGEKLHERLFGPNEVVEFRNHPKIMHTKVTPLKESELE
jgi:dTDP-glucose 4,6-dehydratase